MKQTRNFLIALGVLVAALSGAPLNSSSLASEATTGIQPMQEFKVAHCCHDHPVSPYDQHCCHPGSSTVYVAPAYGVGAASVRGVSRRTSRRTSRRVSRRR